ncbi:MAG: MoaD/ThiS family protein [Candidatus Bathyarchaeia archaeon]
MRVTVTLYGNLPSYLGGKEKLTVTAEPGTTVQDLVKQLRLPKEEVWLVSVNGSRAEERQPLQDGDEVRIFEPVTGG